MTNSLVSTTGYYRERPCLIIAYRDIFGAAAFQYLENKPHFVVTLKFVDDLSSRPQVIEVFDDTFLKYFQIDPKVERLINTERITKSSHANTSLPKSKTQRD
jgi:hypothetical protein